MPVINKPLTNIITLSLHDALPISSSTPEPDRLRGYKCVDPNSKMNSFSNSDPRTCIDRKSTRLNSSHLGISYAVFCLKKKNIFYIKYINNNILYKYTKINHINIRH